MGFLADLRRAWNNLVYMDAGWTNTARQERMTEYAIQKDYYMGDHRKQLKVKLNQADDNVALNFTGLIVERGVSLLFGEGIEFDLPGETEAPNNQYIDAVWKANKKDILLHKVAQLGGLHGTCYVKIVPDGAVDRETEGRLLPRLIALDPYYMEIETSPEDMEMVMSYTMRWNTTDAGGNEIARKEVTERAMNAVTDEDGQIVGFDLQGWWIRNYKTSRNGQWELISEEYWDYEFAPIVHWQNLPKAWDIYGAPDVNDSLINLQDRINFIASNINRIIRYHAHPKTWGRGIAGGRGEKMTWGPDELVAFQGDSALLSNLEMQSDLTSSQQYLMTLRQSLFDISRTVDLTSVTDKLGALTNFGLRVLFLDSMAKIGTKQELYGEALSELNHRLLVIGGQQEVDGGEVVWPEVLPADGREQMEVDRFELETKIASKQTISQARGYDYEIEQERIQDEQAAGDNVGAAVLRFFQGGQGAGGFGQREQEEF